MLRGPEDGPGGSRRREDYHSRQSIGVSPRSLSFGILSSLLGKEILPTE